MSVVTAKLTVFVSPFNHLSKVYGSERVYDKMQEVIILRQKDKAMIDKKKATAMFLEKLEAWEKSQEGQTSGYAYEKSYEDFIGSLSEELLQESMGKLPKDRNQKKSL